MRVRVGVVAGAVAMCLLLASAPPAGAKSYRFSTVRIDATVRPDGSLRLVERRTFVFQGSFSSATYTVDWPAHLVSGLSVAEGGVPVHAAISGGARSVTADWTYQARNERRTWTISYTALCAVRVYRDAAHLLWRFVGRWGVPTEVVEVTIHLPGVADHVPPRPASCPDAGTPVSPPVSRPLRTGEARAWGHGPYNGVVALPDPSTVTLRVTGLLGEQYVEGSVLLPPETVPYSAAKPRLAYDDIVAVEKRLARRANEARQRAEEREQRQREREAAREAARLAEAQRRHDRAVRLSWWLTAAAAIAAPLLILLARRRDRVAGIPRVLADPPEPIHPVQLAMQWSAYKGFHAAKNAYRAQLLHLAAKRVIELSAVGLVSAPSDLIVRLVRRPDQKGPDADFVDFLFPEGTDQELRLSTLGNEGGRRRKLRRWWTDVMSKSQAATGRIRSGNGRIETALAWTVALGVSAGGYAFGLGGSTAAGFVPILAAIAMLIVVLRVIPPRLATADRERFARWMAFRSYLKDFSSLPDAPALAVIIWEHHLVEAVALDVAEEVERQVKALVPVEDLPAPWPGGPAGVNALVWTRVLQAGVPAFAAPAVAGGWRGGGLLAGSGHAGWAAGGFGVHSSGAGFGGGFSGGGGGFGGGLGGHGGGGTHGGAH